MRLAQGGVQNLEIHSFSDTVNAMMERLGIDLQKVAAQSDFAYGYENAPGVPAIWFDQDNYGKNVLVKDFNAYEEDGRRAARAVEKMPLGEASRERLKAFYLARKDVFAGQDWPAKEAQLQAVSYFDFLREHGGLDDECLGIFNNILHDAAGFGTVNLSAMEALYFGMPGWQLLGEEQVAMDYDYPSAMFPDGNASVARLMVLNLIPAVSPGTDAENVALADFDYARLDRETSSVRLRLNATVVHVANERDEVAVRYVRDGQLLQVQARHAVLACYHSVIPHLCPSLPEAQLEALRYQVKHPLLVTNVQIRSAGPLLEAGVSTVHCPGRLHAEIHLWQGNTAGGYSQGSWDALDGPVNLAFWGSIKEPPGDLTLKQRLRGSRAKMLALEFEDYEREVRTVLDGLLGPYGFDVQKDILAITVNRWPHGYAYWYTDLWDEEFEEGQYPHEIARQRFGNIAIANADASAQAYTHTAIEQAWRAVRELRYA
jgi:spermidine dehydrogenase